MSNLKKLDEYIEKIKTNTSNIEHAKWNDLFKIFDANGVSSSEKIKEYFKEDSNKTQEQTDILQSLGVENDKCHGFIQQMQSITDDDLKKLNNAIQCRIMCHLLRNNFFNNDSQSKSYDDKYTMYNDIIIHGEIKDTVFKVDNPQGYNNLNIQYLSEDDKKLYIKAVYDGKIKLYKTHIINDLYKTSKLKFVEEMEKVNFDLDQELKLQEIYTSWQNAKDYNAFITKLQKDHPNLNTLILDFYTKISKAKFQEIKESIDDDMIKNNNNTANINAVIIKRVENLTKVMEEHTKYITLLNTDELFKNITDISNIIIGEHNVNIAKVNHKDNEYFDHIKSVEKNIMSHITHITKELTAVKTKLNQITAINNINNINNNIVDYKVQLKKYETQLQEQLDKFTIGKAQIKTAIEQLQTNNTDIDKTVNKSLLIKKLPYTFTKGEIIKDVTDHAKISSKTIQTLNTQMSINASSSNPYEDKLKKDELMKYQLQCGTATEHIGIFTKKLQDSKSDDKSQKNSKPDDVPQNEAFCFEARVWPEDSQYKRIFAIGMAMHMFLTAVPSPSKSNPIHLSGNNKEELELLYAACKFVSKNVFHTDDKFDEDMINTDQIKYLFDHTNESRTMWLGIGQKKSDKFLDEMYKDPKCKDMIFKEIKLDSLLLDEPTSRYSSVYKQVYNLDYIGKDICNHNAYIQYKKEKKDLDSQYKNSQIFNKIQILENKEAKKAYETLYHKYKKIFLENIKVSKKFLNNVNENSLPTLKK